MKKGTLLKVIAGVLFLISGCASLEKIEIADNAGPEKGGSITVVPEPTKVAETLVTVIPKAQPVNYRTVTIEEKMGYRYVEGSVIITIKNGLYGAVDYEGNTIVENLYSGLWASPCTKGYFALSNAEQVLVFDRAGNIACSINIQEDYWKLERIRISEGVVSYNYSDKDNSEHSLVCIYDLENTKRVILGEYDESDITTVTAMKEGNVYFSAGDTIYVADINGIVREVYKCAEKGDGFKQRVYFEQIPHNGYGVLHIESEKEIESQVGLFNVDTMEVYLLTIKNLIEELGIEEACSYYIHTYYDAGQFLANCKKMMVIGFCNENGATLTEVLLDFSKAKCNTDKESRQGKVTEHRISNISELIVANYDYIELSALGIHYVWNDGCAFYINNEGTLLKEYKRCSNFLQGYAVVVDDNKKAYMIDSEFNKVLEVFDAESVMTLGSAFGIYIDMQLQRLIILE